MYRNPNMLFAAMSKIGDSSLIIRVSETNKKTIFVHLLKKSLNHQYFTT